jgi:hypothetical protein
MKLIIAHFLAHYDFEQMASMPKVFCLATMLIPSISHKVRVRGRQDQPEALGKQLGTQTNQTAHSRSNCDFDTHSCAHHALSCRLSSIVYEQNELADV